MAKFFQPVNLQAMYNQAMRRTGLYQVSEVDTAVAPGAFVVPTGLANNTVYGSSIKDINKMTVEAPTSTDAKGVYVVDVVNVSSGTIAGNIYREGVKTIGSIAEAGETSAISALALYDEFLLGADNFTAAVGANKYAVLTADEVDLTPSATIPATGFTVEIFQTMSITQGTTANETAYLCMVVQL